MATTGPGQHRHLDSRAKWTTQPDPPHTHDYTEQFTAAEVTALKALLAAAGGGGGTTPEPPNPPPANTPPVISNVVVTVTGPTTATVSWSLSENGTGQVEYGTTTAYGSLSALESSYLPAHSQGLSGLTPGQTYHLRVRSADAAGLTAVSGDRTFTTQAASTLPGAPTGLVATGGNAQVTLTWTAPASNGGSAITGYRIFRNGVSLTTAPASPYTDSAVSNGTTYSYTVAAITAVGEGPQSGSASATPSASGDINPPLVSNITITGITTTGATVSWTTNENTTGFVEYGLSTAYGSQTTATSSGTSHSRTLSGLLANKTYHVQVRATDTAGNGPTLSGNRSFTTANTTPTPSPGRPFAAPVTTNTVNVTAGANLQSVVNAAPNGTKFVFPANTIFTVTSGINLVNRSNLVFEGNGSTIRNQGSPDLISASAFLLDGGNSDIRVTGFILEGTNNRTGAALYDPAAESSSGFAVYGNIRIELDNSTIRKQHADGVYANEKDSSGLWARDLWVHDCRIELIARNAFTMNGAERPILERNTIDLIGAAVLDIEPDLNSQGVRDLILRDNSVGMWGLSPLFTMHFVACANQTAAPGAIVNGVSISGNVVTGGAPQSANNNNAGGLKSWIGRPIRMTNIRFFNNSATKAGAGPVLRFENIDTLYYYGNTQPLLSGSLASVINCTDVHTAP